MVILKGRYRGELVSIERTSLITVERPPLTVPTELISMRDLYGEPHGPVRWDHPRIKTGSSKFYKYLHDCASDIHDGNLPKFTDVVVQGVNFLRQTQSVGFVIGGLTTNGKPKSLNWSRLAANVTATQANFGFQVFAATSVPLPAEYSFMVEGLRSDDFAIHWDHNVSALGGAIVDVNANTLTLLERPPNHGYLLVTSGWYQSWGTRREIQMAQEVNALAKEIGEKGPRIIILDVDYSVSGLNNLKAYLIFNTAFAGSLVKMAREMIITLATHPHYDAAIIKDLMEFRDNLPQIKEQFSEVAEMARGLKGEARREMTEDHYKMRQVVDKARRLPTILDGIESGVSQALDNAS